MSILLDIHCKIKSDVYKLRYEHDKIEIKEIELLKEISNAGVEGITPQQLYRDGKGVFGKNRNYLFGSLNNLEQRKLIWLEKVSHKVRKYKVTLKDKEVFELLANSSKEMDVAFNSNLSIIRALSNTEKAQSLYEFVLYSELSNFLEALETYLRVDEKWAGIAHDALLKYNVDNFASLISVCGQSNSDALERAMKKVFNLLNNKRDKSAVLSGVATKDFSIKK